MQFRGSMKVGKLRLLENIYDRNSETGGFVIRLSINHYTDIFNELDPSPLRKRDLDPDFLNYLNECSADIPLKYGIELHIHCPHKIEDNHREYRVREGIKACCSYNLLKLKNRLSQLYRKAGMYILVFIVLMSISIVFRVPLEVSFVTSILLSGFSIGGWVFLWEAIVLLAFERMKEKSEFRRYERLLHSPVLFLYY